MTLVPAAGLSQGRFEVSRVGRQVQWLTSDAGVAFDSASVLEIEIHPFEFNGVCFFALSLTFDVPGEPARYRLVASHPSEIEWLKQTAKQIGDVIGLQVQDHTTVQPTRR